LSVGNNISEDKEDGGKSFFEQLWWVPISPAARVSQVVLHACWIR
jgi:hypothetical protein